MFWILKYRHKHFCDKYMGLSINRVCRITERRIIGSLIYSILKKLQIQTCIAIQEKINIFSYIVWKSKESYHIRKSLKHKILRLHNCSFQKIKLRIWRDYMMINHVSKNKPSDFLIASEYLYSSKLQFYGTYLCHILGLERKYSNKTSCGSCLLHGFLNKLSKY